MVKWSDDRTPLVVVNSGNQCSKTCVFCFYSFISSVLFLLYVEDPDPDSKLTSLLQFVNNWPPCELCASDSTSYSILCALQMFNVTLRENTFNSASLSYWIDRILLYGRIVFREWFQICQSELRGS